MCPLEIEEVKGLPKERGAAMTVEELIEKLSEMAYSTSEIAEMLGVKKTTARAKLNRLHKEGLIERGYGEKEIYWYVTS